MKIDNRVVWGIYRLIGFAVYFLKYETLSYKI